MMGLINKIEGISRGIEEKSNKRIDSIGLVFYAYRPYEKEEFCLFQPRLDSENQGGPNIQPQKQEQCC